jgi:hypothetical protein
MTVKGVPPWHEPPHEPTVRHEHRNYAAVGPWAADAACKDQAAVMEMPEGKRTKTTTRRVMAARHICQSCPVQRACYRWAMTKPDPAYGMMAGGLTPGERDIRRRGQGTPKNRPIAL